MKYEGINMPAIVFVLLLVVLFLKQRGSFEGSWPLRESDLLNG
jgi:hypothetical protein